MEMSDMRANEPLKKVEQWSAEFPNGQARNEAETAQTRQTAHGAQGSQANRLGEVSGRLSGALYHKESNVPPGLNSQELHHLPFNGSGSQDRLNQNIRWDQNQGSNPQVTGQALPEQTDQLAPHGSQLSGQHDNHVNGQPGEDQASVHNTLMEWVSKHHHYVYTPETETEAETTQNEPNQVDQVPSQRSDWLIEKYSSQQIDPHQSQSNVEQSQLDNQEQVDQQGSQPSVQQREEEVHQPDSLMDWVSKQHLYVHTVASAEKDQKQQNLWERSDIAEGPSYQHNLTANRKVEWIDGPKGFMDKRTTKEELVEQYAMLNQQQAYVEYADDDEQSDPACDASLPPSSSSHQVWNVATRSGTMLNASAHEMSDGSEYDYHYRNSPPEFASDYRSVKANISKSKENHLLIRKHLHTEAAAREMDSLSIVPAKMSNSRRVNIIQPKPAREEKRLVEWAIQSRTWPTRPSSATSERVFIPRQTTKEKERQDSLQMSPGALRSVGAIPPKDLLDVSCRGVISLQSMKSKTRVKEDVLSNFSPVAHCDAQMPVSIRMASPVSVVNLDPPSPQIKAVAASSGEEKIVFQKIKCGLEKNVWTELWTPHRVPMRPHEERYVTAPEEKTGRFKTDEEKAGRFKTDEEKAGRFKTDEEKAGRFKTDEEKAGRFKQDEKPGRLRHDGDQEKSGRSKQHEDTADSQELRIFTVDSQTPLKVAEPEVEPEEITEVKEGKKLSIDSKIKALLKPELKNIEEASPPLQDLPEAVTFAPAKHEDVSTGVESHPATLVPESVSRRETEGVAPASFDKKTKSSLEEKPKRLSLWARMMGKLRSKGAAKANSEARPKRGKRN